MKGYKTIIYGLAVAIIPAALTYVGGIDWTTIGVSPQIAAGIGAGIVILRAMTNSAIGSK